MAGLIVAERRTRRSKRTALKAAPDRQSESRFCCVAARRLKVFVAVAA